MMKMSTLQVYFSACAFHAAILLILLALWPLAFHDLSHSIAATIASIEP